MVCELINLFDDIDTEATINAAKNYLQDSFPKIFNATGKKRASLSSPRFDDSGGSSGSKTNHQEEAVIHDIDKVAPYEHCVDITLKAIDTCSNSQRKPYADILYWRYIRERYDSEIYDRFGYSKSQYYRLRNQAFIEFAQRFDSYVLKDVYCSKLPQLLVEKKNGTN